MKKTFLTVLFLTSTVFAAGQGIWQNNQEVKEIMANAYEPNWFSMLFGLCVVISLIYLTGYIYQKLVKVKFDNNIVQNEIEVVTSRSLGQNKNLYIVRVNDDYVLLGATQSNITYIKDVKPMVEEVEDNSYAKDGHNS